MGNKNIFKNFDKSCSVEFSLVLFLCFYFRVCLKMEGKIIVMVKYYKIYANKYFELLST